MQALILAAGKGSRLGSLTENKPKCMIDVAGKSIIDRTVESLISNNINHIIIVIGYLGNILSDYLTNKYPAVDFVFIDESKLISEQHNNIYSFLVAKDELVKDDTLVIESDILFKPELITDLVDNIIPNQAVISYFEDYMNGSCVALDENNHITTLVNLSKYEKTNLYKTVNIYKFSKDFLANTYIPYCETYMNTFGLDCYYEEPLDILVKNSNLIGYVINSKDWFEVDTQEDLDIANILFASPEDKYTKLVSWYGGYHKIPNLVDCCYLTNPFFNVESILYRLDISKLIRDYPAGSNRSITHLSRFYNIPETYLAVGNGATELIKALGKYFGDKSAEINSPTFNEYHRFFNIDNTCEQEVKIIVNPNNPAGWISKEEVFANLDDSKKNNHIIIVDESFMDFVPKDRRFSLMDKDILDTYPNLIVLKSLGKSFGLNGLRIGLIATSNVQLIESIKNILPSWNINSATEEILARLYLEKDNYECSLELVANEAQRIANTLTNSDEFGFDTVNWNGTNFITARLKDISAHKFCVDMLDKYMIIFKDLENKLGEGWIRISINTRADNDYVLNSIRDYIQSNNQR